MASFGVTTFSNTLINQDMSSATQAAHPYEMVTTVGFSQAASGAPTENVKDVAVGLPPGLIGNPNATSRCPVTQLDRGTARRPQVGELTVTLNVGGGDSPITEPLFNVVPPAGMPAPVRRQHPAGQLLP